MDRDRTTRWIATLLVVLLAVRFGSGAALAAVSLPPASVSAVSQALGVYDAVLPGLFLVVLALAPRWSPVAPRRGWVGLLVLPAVALAASLAYDAAPAPGALAQVLPPLAVAAAASASLLSLAFAPTLPHLAARWWGVAYLALLALVPSVLAARVAAELGVGTGPGPGGALQGSWALVNAPTLLLELFAVCTWVMLVPELRGGGRRLLALAPFAAWPPVALLFAARPLAGYILSAVISWGANLALFVPVWLSLNVALAATTCYVSSLLLVRGPRLGARWAAFAGGTASIVLAGFFASAASVEGLALALVLVAVALPRPGAPHG